MSKRKTETEKKNKCKTCKCKHHPDCTYKGDFCEECVNGDSGLHKYIDKSGSGHPDSDESDIMCPDCDDLIPEDEYAKHQKKCCVSEPEEEEEEKDVVSKVCYRKIKISKQDNCAACGVPRTKHNTKHKFQEDKKDVCKEKGHCWFCLSNIKEDCEVQCTQCDLKGYAEITIRCK